VREALREPGALPFKYFPSPYRAADGEPDAAHVLDANGQMFLMVMWPTHPIEETEAVEQEAYRLSRVVADSLNTALSSKQEPPATIKREWHQMAPPVEGKQEPGAEAAPPTQAKAIVEALAADLRTFAMVLPERVAGELKHNIAIAIRAAAGEFTERAKALEEAAGAVCVHMTEAGFMDWQVNEVIDVIRALAASQERSAELKELNVPRKKGNWEPE
jgi:hypothetical protein